MPTSKGLLAVVAWGLVAALGACQQHHSPKPRGYNRLQLPERSYESLPDTFPYTFELNKAVTLKPDTSLIAERYWADLHYEPMRAKVQLTYKALENDRELLRELIDDSYELLSKHQQKTYSIDELIMPLDNGMEALAFRLQGDAPSQFQFLVTDTTTHFLRGALYFEHAAANDSLAPAIDYIRDDIFHLLNTLQWKEQP